MVLADNSFSKSYLTSSATNMLEISGLFWNTDFKNSFSTINIFMGGSLLIKSFRFYLGKIETNVESLKEQSFYILMNEHFRRHTL